MTGGPRRVALTGGIGTGKTYCLRRIAQAGIPTIDADQVARTVVAPGTLAFDQILRRFGPDVVDGSGGLDRAALGRLVFADAGARGDLERIVHPAVYAEIGRWLAEQRAPLAVADIPLLFETGHEGDFDAVIVAACTPEQQLARVMARDGLSEADARRRIQAQLPLAEKRRRATHTVDTSGTMEETDRQVDELVAALRSGR